MTTNRKKLTLSVDESTLANARKLSRQTGRSISRLFSEFVDSKPSPASSHPSGWLNELAGKYRPKGRIDRKSLRREMADSRAKK